MTIGTDRKRIRLVLQLSPATNSCSIDYQVDMLAYFLGATNGLEYWFLNLLN